MSNKLKSLTLLITLGLIWGTGYSIARFAMTHGVTPLGYSFWQSIGPAILLGAMTLFFRKNAPVKHPHSPYLYYFTCGLTGIAIPNSVMYFASPHLPAGLLAVVVNTVPILAYMLALLTRLEKFNRLRFIGILLAMSGLFFILLPGNALPTLHKIPWILVVLMTPCSFAFCVVYIARFRPKNSNSISLSAGTLMTSTIILLPFVFLTHSFYVPHWPLTTPDLIILLEIVLSSIGYILFFQLIKVAGPVYYSLVDTTVALTGLIWGACLFHEKLSAWMGLGIIFIILALILVTQQQRAHRAA